MRINYVQKHTSLTDRQREYIEEKLTHLKKYRRVEDESTIINVNVEFFDSKISNQNISFSVTMVLPHATVRTDVDCQTVEEGIDLAFEKLKAQLDKYKAKRVA